MIVNLKKLKDKLGKNDQEIIEILCGKMKDLDRRTSALNKILQIMDDTFECLSQREEKQIRELAQGALKQSKCKKAKKCSK